MLKEGVYLSKRYEIVRRIGTGGMADVYKGKDHKLRRYVAIKVLKREFGEDESFVKKFQIEAQAAAGMMHPNVVNVYDVGEDRGLNYMVMELVEGITLKDYILKKGKLSDKETISIAIQMASGLEAAHNKNLVHRDVKPQNVMISNDGKVKVTDFGIAKPTTSNTISTNVMGSVHYTSPEQARGGACDIQSDVYSTGVTIYEMVTGTVPFDGDSTVAIAVKHLQEDMLAPSEYAPEMYYSLEQIILKCTQKSPSRRYENMNALILDLKHALIDPDGDFVMMGAMAYGADMMPLTDDEYSDMKREYDEYDDEYGDEDDDEEYAVDGVDGESVDPKMQKITKILKIIVIVIIAFFAIFMIGRAAGVFRFGPGTDTESEESELVEVPNLEGLTKEEAQKTLNALGLGFNVKSQEESAKYEAGLVISQDVSAKEEVEKNTTINVIISSGKTEETVTVPDVTGMTEEQAQKALNNANLSMSAEYEYSDTEAEGDVISTNPGAGKEVAEKSTVKVVVSRGSQKVEVPSIEGLETSKAAAALAAVGLRGNSTEEYSSSVAKGRVISQATAAGRKVEKGTTINFVISLGKEEVIETVTMPNVVGMAEEEAVSLLESAQYELVTTVDDRYSDTVTEGYVISTNISVGTKIEKGTKITLVISMGSQSQASGTP